MQKVDYLTSCKYAFKFDNINILLLRRYMLQYCCMVVAARFSYKHRKIDSYEIWGTSAVS